MKALEKRINYVRNRTVLAALPVRIPGVMSVDVNVIHALTQIVASKHTEGYVSLSWRLQSEAEPPEEEIAKRRSLH